MILSFADSDTERFARGERVARFFEIQTTAPRKLVQLEIAKSLSDLKVPPGNQLKALSGDRQGMHSIRINDKWRICFRWSELGPYDVQIVDYH